MTSHVDPDPVGSASFWPPGSVSMNPNSKKLAKIMGNPHKILRIDRNHFKIISLNIEITLLLNAHTNTKHGKSFLWSIIFIGKKWYGILSRAGSASSWCGSTSLLMTLFLFPLKFFFQLPTSLNIKKNCLKFKQVSDTKSFFKIEWC